MRNVIRQSEKYGSEYMYDNDGVLLFRPLGTDEEFSEVDDRAFSDTEQDEFYRHIEVLFDDREVFSLRDRLIELGDEDFVEFEESQTDDKNTLYSTFRERLTDYHAEEFAKGGDIMEDLYSRQEEEEKGKTFAKYKVLVLEQKTRDGMRVGDYAFADYETDNILEAMDFGKKKMKSQRAYRSNTDDMYVTISQFVPIRERKGNPIYAYETLLSFDEEDLKNSPFPFEKGGLTDSKRNQLGKDISNVADELRDNATEHLKDSMKFMKYAETLQREAVEHKEQAMELNKIQREADLYERGGKIEIDSVSELYDTYFEKYPAATELVAYYVYDYKDDNDIYNMEIGKYGKPIDITPYSELMLNYEYTWKHKMPELDEQVKELMDNESMETGMFAKGGRVVSPSGIVYVVRGRDKKGFVIAEEIAYSTKDAEKKSIKMTLEDKGNKIVDIKTEIFRTKNYAKGGVIYAVDIDTISGDQIRGGEFEHKTYEKAKKQYDEFIKEDENKNDIDNIQLLKIQGNNYEVLDSMFNYAKGGRVSKIDRDIRKFKTQLINKAKRKGIYENFGLNEVRKIEEKYDMYERDDMGVPNYQKLQDFNNWTMNYEPQFERGGVVEQIVKMGGEYDLSNMEHSIPNRAIRYNKDNSRYEIFNYMTDEVDYSDRQLEDILTKANRMFDTNF